MNLRKSFEPVDFKLSEEGDVTVAFSRLNVVDHDGDVTVKGAIPTKAVAISDYNHTSWKGEKPVGRGTVQEVNDLGVLKGRFFMSTDHGRNAYHTVKEMAELQQWSYGYVVLDGGPGDFEGKQANFLRKLDIFEVSPVLLGAGIETATLAIKSGTPGPESPYAEHLSWVHDQVMALAGRTSDRAEWRAKEGRVLSAANRAALTAIRDRLRELGATADELEALLGEPAAPAEDAKSDATLAVLIGTARRLGVHIPE